MTVSTTIIKNFHNGNGSATNFAYQFKILQDTDLLVIIRTNSTGAEATKTLSTHYTVAGAGDASGGSITFTAGNIPASGETVVIRRNVPQTQAIDYIANDPFPAETHEEGLDRGTMVAQQVAEESDRSIKLSRTNTMTSTEFTVGATDRANKVLAFDASGEISVVQELGTFKGNSATTTTAAYVVRDIVKSTTTAQLNNIYICIQASPIGTALTNTSYWTLIVDAVSAATSAAAAASSATAAASSATAATNNGAAQVTLAAAQVALATTQATNSANSATTSGNSATASANSATASANSATAAAASADAFDDIYLGSKSSDPSTDNDGDALAAGMLYFNTTDDLLRVYTGSAWQNAAVDTTGFATLSGTQTLTNKTITAPVIATIVSVSNGDVELAPNGTGHVTVKGNTNSGTIQFNCEQNTHGQQLKAQPHSVGSSAVSTLPNVTGELIPGKIGGTNFTGSLILGHTTTGTLSSAEHNFAVGTNALNSISSGSDNIAIGQETLTDLTSGVRNIAIGQRAMANLIASGNNVVIGHDALTTSTNGGQNTSVGRESGRYITSGSWNVMMGHAAGDNITTGSGNVTIGSVTDVASATGNRQLTIGGNDGSTTTTWITGDSSANVVIGGTVTEYGGASLTTTGKALVMGF